MPSYVTVSLTPAARDALRTLTLELVTPTGRRLPMSEVLAALVEVGRRHQAELLDALRADAETPERG